MRPGAPNRAFIKFILVIHTIKYELHTTNFFPPQIHTMKYELLLWIVIHQIHTSNSYYKVWKKITCSAIYVIFFQKKNRPPLNPPTPPEPPSQPPPPPNLLSTSTPPPPPLGLEPTTLCVVDWCLRPLGHRGCYKSRQEFIYIRFICRRFNSYFKIHTNKYEFLKYENIILKIFQSIKL